MDVSSMPSDPLKTYLPYIVSILVGLVTIIRSYMGGTSCPNSLHVAGKSILITGASSGIGFETAKILAQRGKYNERLSGHIIMCTKNLIKGKEAMDSIKRQIPNADITLKKLDLCSSKSVQTLAKALENFKLDILINNAGVCFHPYKLTEDGYETHLAANYLGHFLLTHLLLSNLRMGTQGRIINVCAYPYKPTNMPLTTLPDRTSFNSKEWYTQSKFALIQMTQYFATLLEGTNVTVNALNPGMVRNTLLGRHSFLLNSWSAKLTLTPWMWLLMKSPVQGAQTSVYLATEPTLYSTSGRFFSNCSEEPLGEAFKLNDAKILYDKTCVLLKMNPFEKQKA